VADTKAAMRAAARAGLDRVDVLKVDWSTYSDGEGPLARGLNSSNAAKQTVLRFAIHHCEQFRALVSDQAAAHFPHTVCEFRVGNWCAIVTLVWAEAV